VPTIKVFFPTSACSANANAQKDSPIKHKDRGKTHNGMTHKHKTFSRLGASLRLLRECTHTGINCFIKGTGDRKVHYLYSTLLHFNIFIQLYYASIQLQFQFLFCMLHLSRALGLNNLRYL